MKKKNSGQFKVGNSGGPGRPSRAVELDYLAALSDAVPMETWRKTCERAAKDATNGDAKARDWLAKYLVGESSSLFELAKLEAFGLTVGDYLAAAVDAESSLQGGVISRLIEQEQGVESLYLRARRLSSKNEQRI